MIHKLNIISLSDAQAHCSCGWSYAFTGEKTKEEIQGIHDRYIAEEPKPMTYLGDGVYGIFDGYGVWLHVGSHDHPTDKVYLEPDVLKKLNEWIEELKKEWVDKYNAKFKDEG